MANTIHDTNLMGRVIVHAKIENLTDLLAVDGGHMSADDVRVVEVDDALVDTGCTFIGLPAQLIEHLGLPLLQKRPVRTAAGPRMTNIHYPVKLTVQDRFCHVDVMELPNNCPVLIGQVPLELLDFVVDPNGRRLIGNPEHGGEQMFDMF